VSNGYVRPIVQEQVKDNHSRSLFYAGMAIFIGLIFVKNLFMEDIPVLAILAVASAVALISDRDELCAMAVCCIPLSSAFQYKYFIFICMLIYLMKYYVDLRITTAAFPLFLMLVWELLHGFSGTFSIVEYARGFAELIFCTFLLLTVRRKVDYPFVCRMLATVTICILSIAFFKILRDYNYSFEAAFSGGYRFGEQGEEGNYLLSFNANGLGFICNLAMVGLMQLNLVRRGTFANYVMIAVLFLFGVMTMSRSFMLCFALIMCCYALARAGRNRKRVFRTVIMIVFIGALILAVYRFVPVLFEQYLGRFMEDDVSGGRTELLVFYTKHIFSDVKYLFFGIGLQDIIGKLADIYGNISVNVPHNGIQEILVCWGLPGFVFFVWHLLTMVKKSKRLKGVRKHRLLSYMPLILVIFECQSGQLIRSGNTLFALSLAYLSLCWDVKETTRNIDTKG